MNLKLNNDCQYNKYTDRWEFLIYNLEISSPKWNNNVYAPHSPMSAPLNF